MRKAANRPHALMENVSEVENVPCIVCSISGLSKLSNFHFKIIQSSKWTLFSMIVFSKHCLVECKLVCLKENPNRGMLTNRIFGTLAIGVASIIARTTSDGSVSRASVGPLSVVIQIRGMK